MSETTRRGLAVLGAALVLGVLADALLRTTPWGSNLLAWAGLAVLTAMVVAHWRGIRLTGAGRWLAIPALVLCSSLVWRDSPGLTTLNLLALGGAISLMTLRTHAGRLRVGGVATWALAPVIASLFAAIGPLLPVTTIRWQEAPRGTWLRQALAVGVGLAIALPLLLVFGGLFAAADATFDRVFTEIMRWLFTDLAAHIIAIGFAAWVVAGLLHQALLAGLPNDIVGQPPQRLRLGAVELGVILGLLDALFLIFVVTQLPYLFGGATLVAASPTLTYAEYARRGFMELIVVAALALPIVLLLDWFRRDDRRHAPLADGAANSATGRDITSTLFVALAGGLIGLLLVVMASAAQRLWLYTVMYGLTEQRLYAAICLFWLAVVCLWFAATVLTAHRQRFAAGAAIAAFGALLLLNIINPDALIVATNAGRANTAQSFDARYVATLSADAVPALMTALPALKPEERRTVATHLLRRWSDTREPDWRSWNWSRWLARQVVAADEETLRRLSTAPSR